jgi:hypothetical protein
MKDLTFEQLTKLIDLSLLQYKLTGRGYPHDLIRRAMALRPR